jgi:hypothetical protein
MPDSTGRDGIPKFGKDLQHRGTDPALPGNSRIGFPTAGPFPFLE